MTNTEAQARAVAEHTHRVAQQLKINEAAKREAIRKEAAALVNWLHR